MGREPQKTQKTQKAQRRPARAARAPNKLTWRKEPRKTRKTRKRPGGFRRGGCSEPPSFVFLVCFVVQKERAAFAASSAFSASSAVLSERGAALRHLDHGRR